MIFPTQRQRVHWCRRARTSDLCLSRPTIHAPFKHHWRRCCGLVLSNSSDWRSSTTKTPFVRDVEVKVNDEDDVFPLALKNNTRNLYARYRTCSITCQRFHTSRIQISYILILRKMRASMRYTARFSLVSTAGGISSSQPGEYYNQASVSTRWYPSSGWTESGGTLIT